jgi:hypothetical protein
LWSLLRLPGKDIRSKKRRRNKKESLRPRNKNQRGRKKIKECRATEDRVEC